MVEVEARLWQTDKWVNESGLLGKTREGLKSRKRLETKVRKKEIRNFRMAG